MPAHTLQKKVRTAGIREAESGIILRCSTEYDTAFDDSRRSSLKTQIPVRRRTSGNSEEWNKRYGKIVYSVFPSVISSMKYVSVFYPAVEFKAELIKRGARPVTS